MKKKKIYICNCFSYSSRKFN